MATHRNMIFETGQPFTIEDSSINANIGQSIRPNRIATGYNYTGLRGVDYPWYSSAAFSAVPACASQTNCTPDQYGFLPFADGTSGRNILDGPGIKNIDWLDEELAARRNRTENDSVLGRGVQHL